MYLLDTNHCSRIIFGDSHLFQQLQLHSEAGIATSVVVCGELLYMAAKSERSIVNLQQVRAFLDTTDIYPVNLSISQVYGNLKGQLVNTFGPKEKAQRRNFNLQAIGFGDNDLWIAATAIHYNLTVVSTDNDFRRIQQVATLVVESWLFG
jgi:tRNA(fMet)-specific endonuclease VapC